eukprot:3940013-Pyramimonas_sp.AAC.1
MPRATQDQPAAHTPKQTHRLPMARVPMVQPWSTHSLALVYPWARGKGMRHGASGAGRWAGALGNS